MIIFAHCVLINFFFWICNFLQTFLFTYSISQSFETWTVESSVLPPFLFSSFCLLYFLWGCEYWLPWNNLSKWLCYGSHGSYITSSKILLTQNNFHKKLLSVGPKTLTRRRTRTKNTGNCKALCVTRSYTNNKTSKASQVFVSYLAYFSSVLRFIEEPSIFFAEQNK